MKVESICCNPMSKASRFLSSMETGRRLQNQCTYFTFYSSSYVSVVSRGSSQNRKDFLAINLLKRNSFADESFCRFTV